MRTITEENALNRFGENYFDTDAIFFWDYKTVDRCDSDTQTDEGFFVRLDKMLEGSGREVVQIDFDGDAYPWFIDLLLPTDKFDNTINAGDVVDVQKAGEFKVHEVEGDLYFSPYGKMERVRDYFKNDLIKVER